MQHIFPHLMCINQIFYYIHQNSYLNMLYTQKMLNIYSHIKHIHLLDIFLLCFLIYNMSLILYLYIHHSHICIISFYNHSRSLSHYKNILYLIHYHHNLLISLTIIRLILITLIIISFKLYLIYYIHLH